MTCPRLPLMTLPGSELARFGFHADGTMRSPEGWRFVVMRARRPPCRPGMAARPVAQTCDGQWLATVKSLAREKEARVPMAA